MTHEERGSWRLGMFQRLWESLRPTQLLVASFILLIGFGTLGFLVLPGLYVGEELGFLDALFTATSAVCVTGLASFGRAGLGLVAVRRNRVTTTAEAEQQHQRSRANEASQLHGRTLARNLRQCSN